MLGRRPPPPPPEPLTDDMAQLPMREAQQVAGPTTIRQAKRQHPLVMQIESALASRREYTQPMEPVVLHIACFTLTTSMGLSKGGNDCAKPPNLR